MNFAWSMWSRVAPLLLVTALWVTAPWLAQAADERDTPLVLRPVAIRLGNRDSGLVEDESRWQQTPLAQAAAAAGIDVKNPSHPLFVHSYRNGRLFYLFYNTVHESFGARPYLIQRIKRTTKDYPTNDGEPTISENYLVEVLKLSNGSFRPDQHFGSYALRNFQRREMIKECEIGFGEIPGYAEGTSWPFERNRVFKIVQEFSTDRSVFDKVQFSTSNKWEIRVSFDRNGTHRIEVPALQIDAPNRLPDPKLAEPEFAAESANVVLLEGRGVLDVIIGKSKTTDVELQFGKPVGVERASAAAQNLHYKNRLTFNIYDNGDLNTIMTRGGFAGKTSKGIGLKDTRQQVVEKYGDGESRGNNLAYSGVIFQLDTDDRVQRIVIAKTSVRAKR